ncbi:MAG: hypothetical protein ACE5KH_00955 [Candidatus Geothermarchaeales archaeon]
MAAVRDLGETVEVDKKLWLDLADYVWKQLSGSTHKTADPEQLLQRMGFEDLARVRETST